MGWVHQDGRRVRSQIRYTKMAPSQPIKRPGVVRDGTLQMTSYDGTRRAWFVYVNMSLPVLVV